MALQPDITPASVNETKPQPDDKASDNAFIDPVFTEGRGPLADDPESKTIIVDRPEGEAEAEPIKEKPQREAPTPEQLKALLEDAPTEAADDDGEEEDGGEEDGDDSDDHEADTDRPKRTRSKARRERRQRAARQAEEMADLRRRNEVLEAILGGAAGGQQQTQPQAEEADDGPAAPARPKFEDFDTAEEWAEALAEYSDQVVEFRFQRQQREAERAQQEAAQQRALSVQQQAMRSFAEQGIDRYPDFEDAVLRNPSLPISRTMMGMILQAENGPDIAYYLSEHPDESREIAQMNLPAAARAIGRLEARLESPQSPAPRKDGGGDADNPGETEGSTAEQAAAAQARTPNPSRPAPRQTATRAPAPIRPLEGGDETVTLDPKRMSMDEYIQARRSGRLR